MGAAPASLAKAASEVIHLVRPRQHELRCRMRSYSWLLEQLRCELPSDRFDLSRQLALLDGKGKHPSGDRAQREHAAAKLGVALVVGPCGCEALQEPCTGERPQLAAQRLRRRDQQVTQLAERGPFRVHGPVTGGHQRPQRLALSAAARPRRPLLLEHTPSRPDPRGPGTVYVDATRMGTFRGQITGYQPPSRIAFRETLRWFDSDLMEARPEYLLEADRDRTIVHHRAEGELFGLMRLMKPVAALLARSERTRTVKSLKRSLESG